MDVLWNRWKVKRRATKIGHDIDDLMVLGWLWNLAYKRNLLISMRMARS